MTDQMREALEYFARRSDGRGNIDDTDIVVVSMAACRRAREVLSQENVGVKLTEDEIVKAILPIICQGNKWCPADAGVAADVLHEAARAVLALIRTREQ